MSLPLLALVFSVVAGSDSVGTMTSPERHAGGWTEMLASINAVRATGATCGSTAMPSAPALVWSARLARAARRHSRDMAENDYFDHVGLSGEDVGDRAHSAGYDWRIVAENIARYQRTVSEVVDDWLDSPSHCRQILDPEFREVGVAEVDDYWTQVFGVSFESQQEMGPPAPPAVGLPPGWFRTRAAGTLELRGSPFSLLRIRSRPARLLPTGASGEPLLTTPASAREQDALPGVEVPCTTPPGRSTPRPSARDDGARCLGDSASPVLASR